MENKSFLAESQEPSRIERLRRLIGGGTLQVAGMESRSQAEQKLVKSMVETPEQIVHLPTPEKPLVFRTR